VGICSQPKVAIDNYFLSINQERIMMDVTESNVKINSFKCSEN